MNLEDVGEALTAAGLEVGFTRSLPHGSQIRLGSGAIVNVYDSGRIDVQGRNRDPVYEVLGIQPPAKMAPQQLDLTALVGGHRVGAPGERQCVVCRSTDLLERHHLDGNRVNNQPDNLVGLCDRCHTQLHKGGWADVTREVLLGLRAQVDQRRLEMLGSMIASLEDDARST